jgi:hypothetical protein
VTAVASPPQIKLTNPATFTMVPAWGEMMAIPRSRQREAYADPAWRERAWAETNSGRYLDLRWSHFTVEESRSAPRCNGISIEQLTRDSGKNPVEVMCDLALADDLETTFGVIFANDDPSSWGRCCNHPVSCSACPMPARTSAAVRRDVARRLPGDVDTATANSCRSKRVCTSSPANRRRCSS